MLEYITIVKNGDSPEDAVQLLVSEIGKDAKLNKFISQNKAEDFVEEYVKDGTFEKVESGDNDFPYIYNSSSYSGALIIKKVKNDLYDKYLRSAIRRRSSRIKTPMKGGSSRSMPPRGSEFKMLFPFIFMRLNGSIPHYFILYFEDGQWYIYSSYGSDYVRIGIHKIEVTLHEFIKFMNAMNTFPRTDDDEEIIDTFMRTKFLLDPTQVIACVENLKGNTVRSTPGKLQGVNAEIAEYIANRTYVLYIPGFDIRLRQVMDMFVPTTELKSILDNAGLSLDKKVVSPKQEKMNTVLEDNKD